MRQALLIIFVANLILNGVMLAVLPDQVAIHFGAGGKPDSWASREFNAAIFLVLEVPFFLLFYFAPVLTTGVSRSLLNLPNKDYWLQDENLQTFHRKFGSYMAEFGVAIFVFFFCLSLLTLQANRNDPVRLNTEMFMVVFVLFMLFTVYWLVKLVRGLRIPAQAS